MPLKDQTLDFPGLGNLADPVAVTGMLLTRTLELCRVAKDARLRVTQGRVIDVFRSLRGIQFLSEDEFRLALRTNLASSREEEQIFDRVFNAYWYGTAKNEGYRLGMRTELLRGEFDQGLQEAHPTWRPYFPDLMPSCLNQLLPHQVPHRDVLLLF